MTEQKEVILMDGEPLEVGDPVWCFIHGELIFHGLTHDAEFPFAFRRPNGATMRLRYTRDFRFASHYRRTLFWQEFNGPPPPKLKKRVKVWDWFVERPNGALDRLYNRTEQQARDGTVVVQKIDGTEREIEQ